MEYKAVYKCRLCGETYISWATGDKKVAEACMVELTMGIKGTVPLTPTLTETHDCGGEHDGSLGLADFQGWEATAPAPKMPPAYMDDRTESGLLEE